MNAKKRALAVILAVCVFDSSDDDDEKELPRKQRSVWVKNWVMRRDEEGFCAKLYRELREEETDFYRNFVHMTPEQFDHLLSLVKPYIEKNDTTMRKSISPLERLVLTLRFLATGENFRSLQFLFRIPQPTISRIIPEVLDALYKVLVGEYLKVRISIRLHSFIFIHSFISHYFRRRQMQRLGESSLANTMTCGNFPIALVHSMESMWLWWRSRMPAAFFIIIKVHTVSC